MSFYYVGEARVITLGMRHDGVTIGYPIIYLRAGETATIAFDAAKLLADGDNLDDIDNALSGDIDTLTISTSGVVLKRGMMTLVVDVDAVAGTEVEITADLVPFAGGLIKAVGTIKIAED